MSCVHQTLSKDTKKKKRLNVIKTIRFNMFALWGTLRFWSFSDVSLIFFFCFFLQKINSQIEHNMQMSKRNETVIFILFLCGLVLTSIYAFACAEFQNEIVSVNYINRFICKSNQFIQLIRRPIICIVIWSALHAFLLALHLSACFIFFLTCCYCHSLFVNNISISQCSVYLSLL